MESENSSQSDDDLIHELSDDSALLANALGGWKGVIDSGLPSTVFIVGYMVSGHNLNVSIWAALASAAVLAVVRLVRRQSLQQVLSGLLGVALAAFLAHRSGTAQNFFLPGILTNLAYATLCFGSILIKRPVLGYVLSAMRGQDMSWRNDPLQHRLFSTATWIWTLVFGLRVAIMLPLYFMGQTEALGFLKLALGWPLFALGAYATYRLLTNAIPKAKSTENS
jgi:hypothetical protein